MRWNYEGLDQQTVTDFKNAGNVEIDIPVIGTVFEIPIDFGDGITILPPSNPGVSKNFDYDKDTQVMTFTVTVDAEDGNVPPEFPIVVSDVMGDAYISFVEGRYIYRHDPFFEVPDDYVHPTIGESTADQGTFSEVPSEIGISHMYRGDTVEFTYKLKVDLNKIEILGQEDESMNNTVRLLGKDEQDNLVPYDLINSKDDSSDDIASVTPIPDVIDMTKTHEVTAGAEGGSSYVDVNWTIVSNSRQQISLGGSTITDSLRFDPKNISMAYSQSGGLTVVVKNNNNQVRKTTIPWNQVTTTQTTDELTGEKILTWVWNVPETDTAAYTYEISYTTRSNMRDFKNTDFAYNYVIGRTGEANDQVLITRPGNGKYVGITKENLWTQAQTVKWEVVLRADSVGYDSCYITDTLPGSWINGLLYKDTIQTGSNQGYEITVDPDDLYEGESYEISYVAGNKWTRDAVIVRFFKEDESGVRREGLYPADPADTTPITVKRSDGSTEERAYREIHLQYVTLNNIERYEMEDLVGDALYHTNRAEVLADTFNYAQAEAYASPVKPTFFKVFGNQQYPTELNKTETYPAWYFRLVFGGVTDDMLKDGKIIITDQWDLDHPELFELFAKPNNANMDWGSGWNWLFAKLYVSPKPTYPSIADGGMLVWRHGANTVDDFKTKENSVLLPSQEGDGPICKLFATDDGNGHVTFEIENLPKKENGQYWDWYQIICFVVPQGDAAVEELKRLASVEVLEGETPGIQKMTNTAEWVNDLGLELTGSADYQYQNIMMTKEIVSQSGNWVTYRISVNPNGLAINNGEPLTLVDAYSTNQSVDYNSIHVSPEYGSSWDYGGSIKEGEEDKYYLGTYKLPDATPVVITYRTRVTGQMGETVPFDNYATLTPGNYTAAANGTYSLVPTGATGSGSAGIFALDLFKYASDHMEGGLASARFRLLDGNKRPIHYRVSGDGFNEGDDIIFETDETGHVWIRLLQDKHGVSLRKNTAYYLEELQAPVTADGSENIYYQRDNTLYSFMITTDPNYNSGGIYTYYNGDILKVRNKEDETGLNITKRFSGNIEPPDEFKNGITFTLQKKTGPDTWETVKTYTYDQFTNGAVHAIHISAQELEEGAVYRVMETNDVWGTVTHTQNWSAALLKDEIVTDLELEHPDQYAEFTATEETLTHSIEILVNNEYLVEKYEIKKVSTTGEALSGAEFKVYTAADNTVVPGAEYITDTDGTLTILWSDGHYTTDTLYYVTETTAPAGYMIPRNSEKFYFYFSNTDQAFTGVLPAGAEAINLNNSYESLIVENAPNTVSIPVHKTWGPNGEDAWPSEVASIRIGLYSSINGSSPTKVIKDGQPLTLTLTKAQDYDMTTFANLPGMDGDNYIDYSIREEAILNASGTDITSSYRPSYSITDENWYLVNNEELTTLTLKKEWYSADGTQVSGNGKDPVTFDLYRTTNTLDSQGVPVGETRNFRVSEHANVSMTLADPITNLDLNDVFVITFQRTSGTAKLTVQRALNYSPYSYITWEKYSNQGSEDPTTIRIRVDELVESFNKDQNNGKDPYQPVLIFRAWGNNIHYNVTVRVEKAIGAQRSEVVDHVSSVQPYSTGITVSQTDNWQKTISNLEKVDPSGNPYHYYVLERRVDGYADVYQLESDGENITIKNTENSGPVEQDTVSRTVVKVWDHGTSPLSVRPASITVNLMKNGTDVIDNVTLNSGNSWTGTINDLPMYDEHGAQIEYTWVESVVPEGYTLSSQVTEGSVTTLTNKYTKGPEIVEVNGVKTWEDSANAAGYRPRSININLLEKTDPNAEGTKIRFKTVTADDGWTWRFPNLPKYRDGEQLIYTVEEEPVMNYETTYDGCNITNTYTPEKISVTVTKIWEDGENADNDRPSTVTVRLYKDGVESQHYDLSESDNWTHTFPNLDKYSIDERGQIRPATYTVHEDPLTDYETVYIKTADGYEIKNTRYITLNVTKTWDDRRDQSNRPSQLVVKLYADNEDTGKFVTLNAGNEWSGSLTVPVFKGSTKIQYEWVEPEVSGYLSDGLRKTADAGGTNFINSLPIKISGTKVWKDANNQDGKRPDTVKIILKANGSDTEKSVTINKNGPFTWEFDNLPKYENGVLIDYTVDEERTAVITDTDGDDTYKAEISGNSTAGFTVTNTHTPQKTNITVKKNWDDASDQAGKRSGVAAAMQLYQTVGTTTKPVGEPAEVGSNDDWSKTWENLPVYENGTAITYSVRETFTNANGYTSSAESPVTVTNGGEETITNSYTPETTSITVIKNWDDNNDQDGKRSGVSASMQLYKTVDGKTSTVGDPVPVGTANDWSKEWTDIPVYEDGKAISYSVIEIMDEANGYTSDGTSLVSVENDSSLTITNSYTPNVTTITVIKNWDDNNDQDGKRSGVAATVQLYKTVGSSVTAVGRAAEVGKENNWTKIWSDLPTHEGGKQISYSVSESLPTPNGYASDCITAKQVSNGSSLTITNSYTPANTSITVKKVWNDVSDRDGKRNGVSASIQLYKSVNGSRTAVGDPVPVGTENNWSKEWLSLPVYENGKAITYSVSETLSTPNGYTSDAASPVTIDNGGILTITNTHDPEKINISGTKVWDDLNDKDSLRPDSVTIRLYANGADTGRTAVVSKNGPYTWEFTDVDRYANGSEIRYTVDEDRTGVITGTDTATTYAVTVTGNASDGFTITNKHTPRRTDIVNNTVSINKVDDEGTTLPGAVFDLYHEDTSLKTFSGSAMFTISTADDYLASLLPEDEETITLDLKETTAPDGYNKTVTDHLVTISASKEEGLKEGVYVTTITYTIKVNGESQISIANSKKTETDRVDDSVTVTKTDQSGADLTGAVFTLYSGETAVKTYNAPEFTISTTDLPAECLPEDGAQTTLTLKETTVPDGYAAPDKNYEIVISASDNEALTNGVFVTTRTYVMTIDSKETLTVTNTKQTGTDRVDNSVTVIKQDETGAPLTGATFTLYSGTTAITNYTDQSFTISTDDEVLAPYLPAANGSITLNLKETSVPAGYSGSTEDALIVIEASANEELKDHVFVTTTTYTITINGAAEAKVTNTKQTGTARVDDSVTVNKVDQDGKLLTGETFTLSSGETVIGTYSGSTFTISTNDPLLASYLPEPENPTTLMLTETTVPDGYEAPNQSYTIQISASDNEELTNNEFITTRTYVMTIDNAETITVTNTKKTGTARVDDAVTITKTDEEGNPLSAETFTLYSGETAITTYSGESFTISTSDEALAQYLPAANSSVTLNLKETAAPAGYSASSENYPVVIAATSKEELKDHVFVTTTTYTINVNGAKEATVINTKKTGTARVDDSVTVNKVDQDGKVLTGETFTLYSGETVVGTYSGSAFTISTNDTALSSYLPTDGNTATLTLVETTVPEGYEAPDRSYELVISASDEESLINDIYVTTRTYNMTIDNAETLTVTNTKKTGTNRVDDILTIQKTDEEGNPLAAETFTLYSGETVITTYSGESFTISTSDEALEQYLPAANSSIILDLKETAAPEGYRASSAIYHIMIAATAREALTEGVFITTTTYTITVNGDKTAVIPNTKETGSRRVDGSVFVTKVDQDGAPLSGESFTLYSGQTAVKSYSGTSFTISTNDTALTPYLPTPGNPTNLTLKETKAPDGYELSETEYNIEIRSTVEEELEEDVFVTTTTYSMTINGAPTAEVVNRKKTGTARADDFITINKVDENGDPLSAETFSLYSGETFIRDYSGESFTINTADKAFASYLPEVGSSVTLTLREPVVPEGYNPSTTEYPIVIAAAANEALTDDVFVTTTTYTISVNGQKQATVTNTKKTGKARIDDEIFVTKVDQDNKPLSGEVFTLFDGQTAIKTFSGTTFTISTSDAALASYLPRPDSPKSLTLKETKAPDGYTPSDAEYTVEITAVENEQLTNGVFITTTAYSILINGEESVTVPNTRRTGTDRIDDHVTIFKVDGNGNPLSAETFSLYKGETLVRSYSGESFTINTDDEALAPYLPDAPSSVTLTLREPVVPEGYNPSTTEYPVVIAATANEALTDGVFVTTTTYTISVNGQKQATITNTKKTGKARIDDEIFITKADRDNTTLNGAIFTLFDSENTAVKAFSGGAFTINTNDSALTSYLPAAGDSETLTLKETKAPDGYEPSDAAFSIEITASANEELKDGIFVTTTTYHMTIDGKDSITVPNPKKTAAARNDECITIYKVDEDNKPLSAETFSLYSGETLVRSYSGESFTICTDDEALDAYLPVAPASATLMLKEPVVPDGYNASTTDYPIVISAEAAEELTEGVFVTTTTYTISVNGEKQATVTNTKKTGTDRVDDEVLITKVDQNNALLSGAVFTLYDGQDPVTTFSAPAFDISTDDLILAPYLPEPGNTTTLKLKETEAPDGYERSDTEYVIEISASADETLDNGIFVTTTTYHMTINGGKSVTVSNIKKTGFARVDNHVTVKKTDQYGKAVNDAVFTLYNGENPVRTYTGSSFDISTDDPALAAILPAPDQNVILMLKETSAPDWYELSKEEFVIDITSSQEEELTGGVFITTTTYDITINGKDTADVIDPYRGSGRVMMRSSKHIVDADGNPQEAHQIPFELWYKSIFFLSENDPARVPFISRDVTIQDDGTTPFTYPVEYTLADQADPAMTEDGFFRVSLPELEKKNLAKRSRNADGAMEWTVEYYLTEKTVVDKQLKPPDQSFDIRLTLTDDQEGHILPTELSITEVSNGHTAVITDPEVLTDTENGIGAGEFVNRERLDTVISGISGRKILTGRELRDSDTWKFTISSADDGPLPEQISVLNEMDRFAFGPITFTASDLGECHMTADGTSYTCEEKTYHYTVTESGTVSGVTNDAAKEFTITVSVGEDGNVKAVCEPESLDDVLSFTNTYVPAPVSLQFGGTKTLLDYPEDQETPEFTFTLQEAGGSYTDEKTIRGDGAYLFDAISFDRTGEYTYIIAETNGSITEIEYDSNTYTIHVEVYDDGSGRLKYNVTDDSGTEVDPGQMNFTNKYGLSTLVFSGKKTLLGKDLEKGEFSFQLLDGEGNVLQTAENTASGEILFDPVSYTKEGFYEYSVKEISGSAENIIYDDTVYHFTVTVTRDERGVLTAEVSGDNIKALNFTNQYQLVFYKLDTLPETGFSAVHPEVLSGMPKDLGYTPSDLTLQIPTLDVMTEIRNVPLYNGEYPVEWLGDAAGMLEGSALPGDGSSIITGHNHLNTMEPGPFALLSKLGVGDRLFITDEENSLQIFRVYAVEKIAEDDIAGFEQIARSGKAPLLLITCEDERPEGGYANRRIVAAEPCSDRLQF